MLHGLAGFGAAGVLSIPTGGSTIGKHYGLISRQAKAFEHSRRVAGERGFRVFVPLP